MKWPKLRLKLKTKIPRFKYLDKPYRPNVYLITQDDKGNNWYAYEDLMEMGILRKLQLDEIQAYADANMTPEQMKIFVQNCREHLEIQDYDHVRKLLAALELRMDFIASKSVYVNLCAALYLLEGEDLIELDKDMYRKKQELLAEDLELQDFFLRDLFQNYRGFTNDYTKRLMDYFAAHRQEEVLTALMLRKMSDRMKEKKRRKRPKKKNSDSPKAGQKNLENSPSKTL